MKIWVLLLLISSCATLPPNKVNELKVCNTPLAQVRLNLLKKEFSLKADEPNFISTNYRMANFGFPDLMAFHVEATSPTSVRITTKIRRDSGEYEVDFLERNEKRHRQIQKVLCAD